MADRFKKIEENTASRRRRTQKLNKVKEAIDELDAFRAKHQAALAEFAEVAKKYNAAIADLEKHIRANPERLHLGPFKTHYRAAPAKIDVELLRNGSPALLLEPGVVKTLDVAAAKATAKRIGCAQVLEQAITESQSLTVTKPKAIQLDWARV
jgi:septal ring factor EnvC (AmiA/AmiB activator)